MKEKEDENFKLSQAQCQTLFSDLLPGLSDEEATQLITSFFLLTNARHYKKFQKFDFSLIRDPMYKFSKAAKERLFDNHSMAFFFLIFEQMPEAHPVAREGRPAKGGNEDFGGGKRAAMEELRQYALRTI